MMSTTPVSRPEAASAERLGRLRAMLADLIREHAAASRVEPSKAQHLADAVIDLRVIIQRAENAQLSDRRRAGALATVESPVPSARG